MMRLIRMFLLVSAAWFCFLGGASVIAQAPVTDPTPTEVRVVARIAAQSYCHTDDESFAVQMKIKLRFTNESDHRVILARHIESPEIVRVAKTVDDGLNGEFEYAPDPHYLVSDLPDAPQFGVEPRSEHFVVLRSHESFEVTVKMGVFGVRDFALAKNDSGLLPRGAHVLQLGVGTWPYQWPYFSSKVDANELANK